ncbi:MAG: TIGR01244 family phosphatase, partial [Sphingomonadaceae bacterium]
AAIPIVVPALGAVESMRAVRAGAPGPVVAFGRRGNRSATLWACARALDGTEPGQLIAAAGRAGFDLSGLAPLLASLAARAAHPQPG